jgi:hypothetical protein
MPGIRSADDELSPGFSVADAPPQIHTCSQKHILVGRPKLVVLVFILEYDDLEY